MLLAPHFEYILATYVFAKLIRSLKSSTVKPDRIFLFFTALVLYIKSHWYSPSLWSLNLIFVCNFLCNRNLSSMKWYIHGSEYLQKYLTGRWWWYYRKGLVREELKLSFTGKDVEPAAPKKRLLLVKCFWWKIFSDYFYAYEKIAVNMLGKHFWWRIISEYFYAYEKIPSAPRLEAIAPSCGLITANSSG